MNKFFLQFLTSLYSISKAEGMYEGMTVLYERRNLQGFTWGAGEGGREDCPLPGGSGVRGGDETGG